MAAPARAASMEAAAISAGVTGTCGFFSVEAPTPVTAQVMKASQIMACSGGGCGGGRVVAQRAGCYTFREGDDTFLVEGEAHHCLPRPIPFRAGGVFPERRAASMFW